MYKKMRFPLCFALAGMIALVTTRPTMAEIVLKAQSTLPTNHEISQSFIKFFVDKVNAAGKGVVSVKYIGGPEVTPPKKALGGLSRGIIDILHSPAAFYIGTVPEGYAFNLTNLTVQELRRNGSFDLLEKIWNKKGNAHILGWGQSQTRYNVYTTMKPIILPDGTVSLKGFKMRTTATYRPLLTGLGATTVGMNISEIYTGLQRGVVQGFGSPDVGLIPLGLHEVVKYRIDPPFYRLNSVTIVNLDKWNKLDPAVKGVLNKITKEYEETSIKWMRSRAEREEQLLVKGGMQVIDLKGEARKKYLSTANDPLWKRLSDLSEHASALRAKMYRE